MTEKSQFFNEFVNSLKTSIPNLTQEIIDSLELASSKAISKLNLITREEFDIQKNVLLKTRLKLELLEKKLLDLENKNS